ncbi:discoidin, CUB and LCCL domain-containing protein 1 [Brienomyrus brachyistius]|uniref:discoidin, CUB and LCCL domain-containing protein 1 n=1 Tax=Brienomyrus brachyistius TaxID=42636 RepID=UPI0020B2830B|nr:discoidin, CUB and LCCL domain-containing protein 1 [Brienomyrus brachyistius]
MIGTLRNIWDAIHFLTRFLLLLYIKTLEIHGQEGDGCGHTATGVLSGTVASRSFPGTYPNNTRCQWRLIVPPGHRLRLAFGDFDLEASTNCRSGSLTITPDNGAPSLGPLCGHMDTVWRRLTLNSSQVTVLFVSGVHRSGRGFLLSYATDRQPDLISCMERGTHYSSDQFSAFCPAGCKDVTGDVWGRSAQGYRDTSVLCKAAIHAGVVSDALGGPITVSRERSITLYESSFANGIFSKTGSLSEKKLVFQRDCDGPLNVSSFNASSVVEEWDSGRRMMARLTGSRDAEHGDTPWVANSDDRSPWLMVNLQSKNSITGIITKGFHSGSSAFYVKSYILLYSKDGRNWRTYKGAVSKEKKVFEGNSDSSQEVLNSLIPPVVAQYILLRPQEWHARPAMHIQVLGCPAVQPRMANIPKTVAPTPTTDKHPVLKETEIKEIVKGPGLAVWLAVGIPLSLVLCACCLLAGLRWKRRANDVAKKDSLAQDCHGFQGKSTTICEKLDPPLERGIHDPLPSPPRNVYASPDLLTVGPKLGSTFRPASDGGYTAPLVRAHYDVPGRVAVEYAEPLLPEPEYATPFGEQPPDPPAPLLQAKGGRLAIHLPPLGLRTNGSLQAQYDCPTHRGRPGGSSFPLSGESDPHSASVLYAEPQLADPPAQHIYHEP